MIELDREQLLALVQTDAELSEILMRAFILRRVELIARDLGDVVVIGSTHCAGTLRVKEFLTRNGHPFHYIDLDRDADAQELLDRFHVSAADVPVADLPRRRRAAESRAIAQIAECLGFNEAIDQTQRPRSGDRRRRSGRVSRRRSTARPKGSTSSCSNRTRPAARPDRARRIENYLGFPTGISGLELTGRAYAQAQKFGAQIMIAKGATGLACDRQPYAVQIDDGARVPARAVIIATGAEYRKPPLENLVAVRRRGRLLRARRRWRRSSASARRSSSSAAAIPPGRRPCFSRRRRKRVHMLVRGDGLADTMSRYLIRRIEDNPAIVAAHAARRSSPWRATGISSASRWRDDRDRQRRDARHPPRVHDDRRGAEHRLARAAASRSTTKGFIKTGPDLSPADI